MSSNFPFSNSPFYNSNKYYDNYSYGNNNYQKNNNSKEHVSSSSVSYNTNEVDNIKNFSSDYCNIVFDIFGLKLHFDDILLICMIFFLFKEDVYDTFLFIALILLLFN